VVVVFDPQRQRARHVLLLDVAAQLEFVSKTFKQFITSQF
jgi:hypothetical protein